jgi:aminoglycoside/choline kinase family phosphotransferase
MTARAASGRDQVLAADNGPSPVEVLEAGLRVFLGRTVRIDAADRRDLEVSSHPVERLRVTLDTGEQLKVVFKRLTTDVRPEPNGSRREVLVYRRLLAGGRFGAPAVYASVFDEARRRFWLFLEDVGYSTLKHGNFEDWFASVRLLAELHATYLRRDVELRALDCLADHDAGYYRAIAAGARWNMQLAGDRRALARYDDLMRPFHDLADELSRQPRTLVHGDIFPQNLAVQPGARIRPIDWESAGIGSPLLDLARLLDGWGKDKPRYLEAYLDDLGCQAAGPVDRPSFRRAFTQCEIISILWNLRWSVEECRDEDNVNGLLDDMEARWHRLRGGGRDG